MNTLILFLIIIIILLICFLDAVLVVTCHKWEIEHDDWQEQMKRVMEDAVEDEGE